MLENKQVDLSKELDQEISLLLKKIPLVEVCVDLF